MFASLSGFVLAMTYSRKVSSSRARIKKRESVGPESRDDISYSCRVHTFVRLSASASYLID